MDTKEHLSNGFLEYQDARESSFCSYIRYETPEETWDEFLETLIEQGYSVQIVWEKDTDGNSEFKGFKFKDDNQKLKFILKYSN